MKKILVCLLTLMIMTGCSLFNKENSNDVEVIDNVEVVEDDKKVLPETPYPLAPVDNSDNLSEEEKEKQKIANDYESLDIANHFYRSDKNGVVKLLKGDGVILFADKDDIWSQALVEPLNKAAEQAGTKVLLYDDEIDDKIKKEIKEMINENTNDVDKPMVLFLKGGYVVSSYVEDFNKEEIKAKDYWDSERYYQIIDDLYNSFLKVISVAR